MPVQPYTSTLKALAYKSVIALWSYVTDCALCRILNIFWGQDDINTRRSKTRTAYNLSWGFAQAQT